VRESRTPGSVRGAGSNPCPYRDSRERLVIPDADVVGFTEGDVEERAIASARSVRRGLRPGHVQKLFVWEPGDLLSIRGVRADGSRREGEEP
jgi:hypothetical protein